MKCVIRAAIKFYQVLISPYIGASCRFRPTCSQYILHAVELHGVIKGLGMGFLRLLRCNALFKGGYDPVPGFDHRRINT